MSFTYENTNRWYSIMINRTDIHQEEKERMIICF